MLKTQPQRVMNENITIRKYASADKEYVINLFRLNTPKYFAASEEEDLVYYLSHHIENHYVVACGDKLWGCGGFTLSDDLSTGKISWDIFHPDHQGKGLGSILTKYRIEKIQEHKTIKSISVRTSQVAFKFYERFGFNLKETIKDYWAEGFDLYRMEYMIKGK